MFEVIRSAVFYWQYHALLFCSLLNWGASHGVSTTGRSVKSQWHPKLWPLLPLPKHLLPSSPLNRSATCTSPASASPVSSLQEISLPYRLILEIFLVKKKVSLYINEILLNKKNDWLSTSQKFNTSERFVVFISFTLIYCDPFWTLSQELWNIYTP